jgi:hypothetical protein
LPGKAVAGITCSPRAALVARIEMYRYRSGGPMYRQLRREMANAGQEQDGYCEAGQPGIGYGLPLEPAPSLGCFVNGRGRAVILVADGKIWDEGKFFVYQRVVGAKSDIAKLWDWGAGGDATRDQAPRAVAFFWPSDVD